MSMSDNHKLCPPSPCYTTTILNPQPFSNTSSLPSPPLSEEKTSPALSIPATKVVEAFQYHEDGCLDQSQLEFWLKRQEYQEVLDYLEQDYSLKAWVDCKIRYNYDPTTGLLEVYMPTTVHELNTTRIVDEIKSRIKQFSAQCALPSALPAFLDVIENKSSSDIFAHDDPDHKRSPYAAFSHPDDQFPGIVIETSYSQAVRKVEKRADEYIMMSDGNIKMVIGLDVEYRPNNQQVDTVSVWRPACGQDQEGPFLSAECILDHEPFRDAKSKTPINPNRALTIPLDAFATTLTLRTHSIPLTDRMGKRTRNFEGVMEPTVVGRRKRKRAPTPPETMTREDKRAWKRKERLGEKKAEEEDESWEE
ncbi:MAG: hypothetical protein M1840_004042 [Geoglossum simile]|nr:MAG: hypothetical protein M1840_004042 [Geoglossum simile]